MIKNKNSCKLSKRFSNPNCYKITYYSIFDYYMLEPKTINRIPSEAFVEANTEAEARNKFLNSCPKEIMTIISNVEKIGYYKGNEFSSCIIDEYCNKELEIKKVYFNDPVTIVMWSDNTKTIVRTNNGDIYDPEKGLAMCISKKMLGNKGSYYDIFRKWLPKNKEENK